MKTFYNLRAFFSSHKKSAHLAQCLAVLAIVAWPSSVLFAQTPSISYSTPQTYTTGTAITLSPANIGGAVPTTPAYNSKAIISTGVSDATCMAMDKAGNIYVGESSGTVLTIAAGGGPATVFATGFTSVLGIAVDALGRVFIAGGSSVWKIPPGGGTAVHLATLSNMESVAVDAGGNIYFGNTAFQFEMNPDGSGQTEVFYGGDEDDSRVMTVDIYGDIFMAGFDGRNLAREGPLGHIAGWESISNSSDISALTSDQSGNLYTAVENAGATTLYMLPQGGAPVAVGPAFTGRVTGLVADASHNLYALNAADGSITEMSPAGCYFVNPELPQGLSIDPASGIISGTVSAGSGGASATDYTIKAFNTFGISTATVNITVTAPLPTISYTSPQAYQPGTAINALSPSSTGVAAWGYANNTVSFASGFSMLLDVAADAAGNVYTVDKSTGQVEKIPAGGGTPVVLASGFNGPGGIACDAAGNLYVADSGNNAVKEIVAGSATVNTIGSGFNAPDAVAVDGAGNVYVADSGNGAVKVIMVGTGATVTVKSGFSSLDGIAVDAAGNIYAADEKPGSAALYKIAAGGAQVSVGTGLGQPNGVAVDAAGNLYVSDLSKSVITVIEPDGGQFTLGSGFDQPNGVALDGAGNVYVADSATGLVKEVKITGGYFLSPLLPAGLSFNNISGTISGTPAAASPAANYTVTAYNSGGSAAASVNINVGAPVISYKSPVAYAVGAAITPLLPTQTGGAVAALAFSTATTLSTGISDAACMAMDNTGNIYIGESSGKVSKLAAGGTSATIFATGFSSVTGIAVDASNNIFVADGASIWKIPAGGGTPIKLGSFRTPSGVAVDAAGNVYVADRNGAGGVFKMAGDGSGQTKISNRGVASDIAADANGNVFIVDELFEELYEIPAGGTQKFLNNLFNPASITADASGNVYVGSASGGSLQFFPAGGGSASGIGPGFSGSVTGIMIDPNFNLYAANNGIISKISAAGGYFVSPELPSGLTIDPTSGAISGTPSAASPVTNYTVTAFNAEAGGTARVNLYTGALPVISYSTPQVYLTGTAITPVLPASTGPVAAFGFNTRADTLNTGVSDAVCMATDKAGNIYIGESSGQVSVLAPGSSLATVYAAGLPAVEGIAADTAGNVYAATGAAVFKIPAGGGTPFALGGSFVAAACVAADEAGNIYVGDSSNGIYKMAADGTGSTKVSNQQVAAAVADKYGNIFLLEAGSTGFYEIPEGGTLKTVALGRLSGIAADPSGNIFMLGAQGSQAGTIRMLPAGAGTVVQVAPAGTGITRLLMADRNFNLYGLNGSLIVKINPTGGYFINPELPQGLTIDRTSGAISGTPASASPAANYTVTAFNIAGGGTAAVNITVNPSAPTISYATPQVYVQNTAITPLSPVSTNVATPGYLSTAITAGSFPQPFAIAVDASGNVYVADKSANSISELLAGGGQVTIGTGLSTPAGVAVDKSGNVYAANQGDNTVVEIQAHTGTQTNVGSGYQRPTAVAVDSAGNVFVADVQGAAGVVYKIPPGQSKQLFKGGFISPNGIAVDAAGNVYVSDFGGGPTPSRVYEISPDGSTETPVNHSFSTATGVAIDATGNLFIVDAGNLNVIEYPAGGGSAITLTAGLTFPFGLSADGAGNLYVADPGTGQVVKLTPAGGYFINRVLPAGLSLNAATGSISGTPTAASAATDYRVTAYNYLGGSGTGTVNISVPLSTNANLTNLTLNHNAVLTPLFAPGQTSYTANVPFSTNVISLTPACDTTATVKVNNIAVSSGTASQRFPLNTGDNTITITVKAQDSTTTKTYTVTVTRAASPNDYLSNLRVTNATLSPLFNYTKTSYAASVVNAITSVKVMPTAADAGAIVTVNNVPVPRGNVSGAIALNTGDNTITTVVTAADGTSKTYTVVITRAASPNANLSNLKVNSGNVALSPAFNYTKTSYTASVTNAVVKLTPAASDANAKIKINGAAVASGTQSASLPLVVGPNTITIIVTAHDGTTTKTYTVTITREAGPIAEPLAAVSVEKSIERPQLEGDGIVVHQGISPNGDGQNDYLVIDGISNYPDNKLMIMNRNGNLVYEARGYDNIQRVFDGHSNKTGAKQLPGTYFYSLDYMVNGVNKHKTGFIVLKY